MAYKTFEASFRDEIRGIPCGQRIVEAEVGRKWVRVRTPGHSAHRVPLRIWEALAPIEVVVRRRFRGKGRR